VLLYLNAYELGTFHSDYALYKTNEYSVTLAPDFLLLSPCECWELLDLPLYQSRICGLIQEREGRDNYETWTHLRDNWSNCSTRCDEARLQCSAFPDDVSPRRG